MLGSTGSKILAFVLLVGGLLFVYPYKFSRVVAQSSFKVYVQELFSKQLILPDSVPSEEEVLVEGEGLEISLARDEKESITFAIYNSGDAALNEVEVKVKDLQNASGQALIGVQSHAVKVLSKRSRWRDPNASLVPLPEVLIPYSPDFISRGEFDVPPTKSKQWVITIVAEAQTAAGIYTGTILISSANRAERQIPLTVKVYPIRLLQSQKEVSGFYYNPPDSYLDCFRAECSTITRYKKYDSSTLEQYREVIRQDFQLMTELGIKTIVPVPFINLSWEEGRVTSDLSFLRTTLEEAKTAGLATRPIPMQLFFRNRIRNLVTQNHPEWDPERVESATDNSFGKVVGEIEKLRKELKLPEFYWYPIDEPFHDPLPEHPDWISNRRKFLKQLVPVIREAVPGAKIWVTTNFDNWFQDSTLREEYDPFVDVQVYDASISEGLHDVNREQMKSYLQTSGDEAYMYYNWRLGHLIEHRVQHGLFIWNLPLKGNVPWTYNYWIDDPYADMTTGYNNTSDWTYTYPNPFGQAPLWAYRMLGVREGIDDNRYFYTLKKAIEQSANAQAQEEARTFLRDVDSTINRKTPSVRGIAAGIPPQTLSRWRTEMAQHIAALGQPQVFDDSDLNRDGAVNLPDLLHWRKNMVLGNVGTQPTGILGYLQVLREWLE